MAVTVSERTCLTQTLCCQDQDCKSAIAAYGFFISIPVFGWAATHSIACNVQKDCSENTQATVYAIAAAAFVVFSITGAMLCSEKTNSQSNSSTQKTSTTTYE